MTAQLRVTRVSIEDIMMGGVAVGVGGKGEDRTTIIAPGDSDALTQANPSQITFGPCSMAIDGRLAGTTSFAILAVPMRDPLNLDRHFLNLQFGQPDSMVVATVTAEDAERVIAALQAAVAIVKFESKGGG